MASKQTEIINNTKDFITPLVGLSIHSFFSPEGTKVYKLYRPSPNGADNIEGNLNISRTKSYLKDEYGKYTATYRDSYMTIILGTRKLTTRPNFTRIGKGFFGTQRMYMSDGLHSKQTIIRNTSRSILSTDPESFQLSLEGRVKDIDSDLALRIAKDIFFFINVEGKNPEVIDETRKTNMFELYNT